MKPTIGSITFPVEGSTQFERMTTRHVPRITGCFTNQPCKKGRRHSHKSNAPKSNSNIPVTVDRYFNHEIETVTPVITKRIPQAIAARNNIVDRCVLEIISITQSQHTARPLIRTYLPVDIAMAGTDETSILCR